MNRRELFGLLLAPLFAPFLPTLDTSGKFWVEFKASVGDDAPINGVLVGTGQKFLADNYEQACKFLDYHLKEGWKPEHIKVAKISRAGSGRLDFYETVGSDGATYLNQRSRARG